MVINNKHRLAVSIIGIIGYNYYKYTAVKTHVE